MPRALVCVLLPCLIGATAQPSARRAANVTTGCVDRFDAAADYFPDKAAIDDAADFSVEYRRSYKVVTVRDAVEGSPPERYVLTQCGTPAPRLTGDLAGAQVVSVLGCVILRLFDDASSAAVGAESPCPVSGSDV
jgi:iron complex transport system substrate-binding protein